MTRAEWLAEVEACHINFTGTGGDGAYGMGRGRTRFNSPVPRLRFLRAGLPDVDMGEGLLRPADHSEVVAAALAAGRLVPARVLAEYPEMEQWKCRECRGVYSRQRCATRRGLLECPACLLRGVVGTLELG